MAKLIITEKVCKQCKQLKPASQFHRNNHSSSGLEVCCKPCRHLQSKQRRSRPGYRELQCEQQKQWSKTRAGQNNLYMKSQQIQIQRELKRRVNQMPPYVPARIVSLDEYEQMLEAQDGRCAICRSKPNGTRLSIDHCHVTGMIRKLLCLNCNFGLGHFKSNPELLEVARLYLVTHASYLL